MTAFANSAKDMVTALRLANPDPKRAVISLSSLHGQIKDSASSNSKLTEVMKITSDLFRQFAAISLAEATVDYIPSNADDLVSLRGMVAEILDAEMVAAADSGSDDVYNTLRDLKASVILDLTSRGESLKNSAEHTMGNGLPGLVLAKKLFQDVGQYDSLVKQVNPVSPLFFPSKFKVS